MAKLAESFFYGLDALISKDLHLMLHGGILSACTKWCVHVLMLNGSLEIHIDGKAEGRITGRQHGTEKGEQVTARDSARRS
jgi:hypothetical protein